MGLVHWSADLVLVLLVQPGATRYNQVTVGTSVPGTSAPDVPIRPRPNQRTSAPVCTWLHLAAPGCTWLYLVAPGCTWLHLVAPGCTWLHLVALGCTWLHLVAPG